MKIDKFTTYIKEQIDEDTWVEDPFVYNGIHMPTALDVIKVRFGSEKDLDPRKLGVLFTRFYVDKKIEFKAKTGDSEKDVCIILNKVQIDLEFERTQDSKIATMMSLFFYDKEGNKYHVKYDAEIKRYRKFNKDDPYGEENWNEGVKWFKDGKLVKDENWEEDGGFEGKDNLIDDDDFVQFLIDNNALEKYKANYINQHQRKIGLSFRETWKKSRFDYVNSTLNWSITIEGGDYWRNLSNKWYEYYQKKGLSESVKWFRDGKLIKDNEWKEDDEEKSYCGIKVGDKVIAKNSIKHIGTGREVILHEDEGTIIRILDRGFKPNNFGEDKKNGFLIITVKFPERNDLGSSSLSDKNDCVAFAINRIYNYDDYEEYRPEFDITTTSHVSRLCYGSKEAVLIKIKK